MGSQIPYFDPSSIPDGSVCLFLGKRGSGKSTLIKDIMSHKTHLNSGMVVSYTEEANGFYSSFIPGIFIYFSLDLARLERVFGHQKALYLAYNNSEKSKQSPAVPKPDPIYIILDDCMFTSKEWIRSKTIKELLFNGRHYGIFLIVAAQYVMSLTPEFRTNIDYVFIAREGDYGNLAKIYNSFFGAIRTKEDFFALHDLACKDYGTLVAHLTSREGAGVSWYKAKRIEELRVGRKEVWELSDEMMKRKKAPISNKK